MTNTPDEKKADLEISLNGPVNSEHYDGWCKAIDKALVPLGFSRTDSSQSDDGIELGYRQFAVAN